MHDIDSFYNLPALSFIDGISIDNLLTQAIGDYEAEYSRLTGDNKVLYPADPMRVLIQTYVLKLCQLFQYVDRAGKQDLLKYSRGAYLDQIAALRGVTRLPAKSATTILRFTLSTELPTKAVIPIGTLATAGDNVFFATTVYAEIPAGDLSAEVEAACSIPGAAGNIYQAGRINIIVQPFPYAAKVTNLHNASGGVDEETDASLSERTFLAPGGYSVAGPDGAYIYWVKTYSHAISDVNVHSPAPGLVDIRVLLVGGELPDQAFLNGLESFISDSGIRPFTDSVHVAAPEVVEYDIDFVYYIRAADRNNVTAIQKRLNTALSNYILWQGGKIGRDINPSILNRLLMETGIKRVVINKPEFTEVPQTCIAKERSVDVAFGGVEID